MITQINSVAEGWWNWMWPMFWQVGVLVVFLGVIDLLLRRHVWPQVRYALWLLVLVKLILPPTFSLSTSIISQARIKTERMATQLIATNEQAEFPFIGLNSKRNAYLSDIGAESFVGPEAIMTNVTKEPQVQKRSSDIAGSDINVKLHWRAHAMVVWLIVMVVLSLWVVIRFRKLRKFHAVKFHRDDLPQWFGALFAQTAEKLGLRKHPEIALSRNISSPAVFGVFRPVLVLPVAHVHRLSQKHTENILLHELAHIKRGDLLVNAFYMLLQIVYWFNPLLWLLRRRLQHIRELCCDATVARILRDKTADYRETILEVTQRYLAKPVEPGLGLLGMTENSSRLLVRLKWLEKKTWRYRGIRIATMLIVVALMSVCVLPMAKAKSVGVLTVAADGSAKYSSIQEAIDAADEGAEIRIGPGVYEEHLRIDKPVKLTGAGWEYTTVMTKNMAAEKFNTAMMKFSVRVADRIKKDMSKQQRNAIMAEFMSEFGQEHATVLVADTKGVVMRGLKFTSPGMILKGRLLPAPVIKFGGAKAEISDCAVIDSPGCGIEVAGDSDVKIRKCLVAAVWNSGILVNAEQASPKTLISETDVRNCYHVGIVIRPGCDSTVVDRCRISGSAWHGIRYDHTSPVITNNLLYGNARFGIYASGKTAATVRQNLFYDNEMAGMSCWSQNRDTIEGNTFTVNERSGLEILGAARPIVRKNIFSKNAAGISRGNINSDSQSAQSAGEVLLEQNIFWDNSTAAENTTLEAAKNLEIDPLFSDAERKEFSLRANSPARRAGIGASDPISFRSRWALQPEEKAIVPDDDTRDSRQWKEPVLSESGRESKDEKPDVRTEAVKTTASEEKQDFNQLLVEYKVLVAQFDKEMAAYRASTPVFARLLDVVATEGPKLNQAREDAGARLAEARKSGVDFKNLKYDEKASEKIISGILAGMFGDIYAEFQKAIDAGKLRLPDEQQTIYYRGGYFVTQSTEPLSGQWHEHSPYEQGTLEYCQFTNQLTYTASMVLSPLAKMAEQVPEALQVKQQRIDEIYERLVRLKRQSKSNVSLDPKYEDPYMKKLKAISTSSGDAGIASTPTPLESSPVVKDLPGVLIFHGRYKHTSRGRDYGEPGELWLKQDRDGSITAIAQLAYMSTTTTASGDRHNRLNRYQVKTSSADRPNYSIDLELLDGKVLLTRRGLRQDHDGKELKVPDGATFSPNTRPDSYCVANILLRGFDLEEGRSKEFRVYDWDNSGDDMADYSIRVEHAGTERVEVPAGTFEANHIVLRQVTSADTWFKKRAGHVTDFWVLDNGVIVRILRHREPYELQLLDYTAPAELPGKLADSEKAKAAPVAKSDLQRMIDSAQTGATVIVPRGVYVEPVTISKPLILKGGSRNECVFEVTSNQPAISVDSKGKGKVLIEGVTIKWQLATSDRTKYFFAVAVKDTVVDIKNCCFESLGNFKRCPVAINSTGFSELNIDACRFEGFEYTVCFGQGTKGSIRNSLIMDSGHQGIMLYTGATVEIIGNVVTGSRFHAVRSTGGTLNMTNNLIINNANRGVYLGNKSASGTIANNVIIGSGTGVGGFARSNVKVENNVIADSIYVGIGMRDSCRLSIRDNILWGNERGLILFKDSGGNGNRVYKNTFWRNKTDAENMDKTADSIIADPGFVDAENGDFSLKPGPVLQQKQGLTNPEVFKKLWKIWKNRQNKNMPFTEN